MNPFGVDVSGLDVAAFLARARVLYALLGLAWLALCLQARRPRLLLLGALLASGWAWGVTNWPLRSLYGLLTSTDRVGNLALVQVVAAGGSPLRTAQAGQLHFEPFWGLLVAALSGFDPERVLALYPFLSLGAALLFPLALYAGLGAAGEAGPSAWERALIAGFAALLSSAPFEFAGTYRVPWAMTFLLKPNHALGLVLFPLFVGAFARIRSWRGRLAVGVLLQLLGWVFVIHMVYACAGLLVFAALSLAGRRPDWRRDASDAAAVIGVNVLAVSPYLAMLFVGYPFLYKSPRAMIPPFSPHLLEASLKHGAVFLLGAWGLLAMLRRGSRVERVFTAQVVAAYLVWAAYLVASALHIARERDEIYYWIRFLTAASAGAGAFDLGGRLATLLGLRAPRPELRCAAIALLALPWSLPYWWDPSRMDSYFQGSREPLPERLREPAEFIRTRTDPRAVFAGDRDYARFVAALGARRVSIALNLHMPPDFAAREALELRLVRDPDPAAVVAAAAGLGVTHFVATPALLSQSPWVRLQDLEARPHLARIHFWGDRRGDWVAIFRIAEAGR